MENRQFAPDLSPVYGTSQLAPQAMNVRKRKHVLSPLRLQPLAPEQEKPIPQLPTTPPQPLQSSVPRPSSQFIHINNTQKQPPEPRLRTGMEQRPVVYPMSVHKASPKVSERAAYTYISAENKSKEIGVVDALLGCAMLLLLAVLVLVVLYYLAS
jgi:hypothetical protein